MLGFVRERLAAICFTPKSGHWNSVCECPLCAKSGREQAQQRATYSITLPAQPAASIVKPDNHMMFVASALVRQSRYRRADSGGVHGLFT